MSNRFSWECPKCGRRYVNGREPTYCPQKFYLKVPTPPRAENNLVETFCGAPILRLVPPREAYGT